MKPPGKPEAAFLLPKLSCLRRKVEGNDSEKRKMRKGKVEGGGKSARCPPSLHSEASHGNPSQGPRPAPSPNVYSAATSRPPPPRAAEPRDAPRQSTRPRRAQKPRAFTGAVGSGLEAGGRGLAANNRIPLLGRGCRGDRTCLRHCFLQYKKPAPCVAP